MRLRYGVAVGVLFFVGTACDNKPAASHGTRSGSQTGTTLPAAEPDAATVAQILGKKSAGEAKSVAGSGALPPGHPPMSGMSPAQPTPGDATLPPGHPPMGGMAAGDVSQKSAPLSLKFDAPKGWTTTPVTSAMRKAQYLLPRAAGDGEDGQLIVFYFGPDQGGTVEMNISRWQGMFRTAEGQPIPQEKVKRATSEVNGMKVTTLDVTGRYADQMGRPDKPGPTDQDFRMLAAIVETPDGPWFFKATGPVKTMSEQAQPFEEFIKSVRR